MKNGGQVTYNREQALISKNYEIIMTTVHKCFATEILIIANLFINQKEDNTECDEQRGEKDYLASLRMSYWAGEKKGETEEWLPEVQIWIVIVTVQEFQ